MNLVLIPSIIKVPQTPLSYNNTRSVFSREERYAQTKRTLETVREKIPNCRILLVECSPFTPEEKDYFERSCDYIINLYDNEHEKNAIFSISKSWGEGTMTMSAFRYIQEKGIVYDRLFKISGRYWLDDFFVYKENEISTIAYIQENSDNVSTALYILNREHFEKWNAYLLESNERFYRCDGYEEIFASFMKTLPETNYIVLPRIGVSGYIAPFGNIMEM